MSDPQHLVAACAAMVVLTFLVGIRLLSKRAAEMNERRIHPDAIGTSTQRALRLKDTRAADNYANLFEIPVMFYALCGCALATGFIPGWLPFVSWTFVLSRAAHSFIQCTYNRVMHRLIAFLLGLFLMVGAWIAYALTYIFSM